MTFGEKLQALRKARGWSQEELATQINVSRQALSKWESGASVPDTENVIALSRLSPPTICCCRRGKLWCRPHPQQPRLHGGRNGPQNGWCWRPQASSA